ncbi:MAG: DNA polymerase III subunit alpha [Acidimicrobiia bacterium]|nr:DNA polymerase III subunit alpha [Acidimicrobiia bacterium]
MFEKTGSFVHLHTHSCFSFREGAARVEDLARAAARMGMSALALTDHMTLAGAVRFTKACRTEGVRPVLGVELPVAPPPGVPDPSSRETGPRGGRRQTPDLHSGNHVTLLARNETGWANLCRLVSHWHLSLPCSGTWDGAEPPIPWDVLCAHAGGLFVLSGCARGEVARWLGRRDMDRAESTARRYLDVFGSDAYALEVSHHLLPESRHRIEALLHLGDHLGVTVCATNNVHYVARRDAVVHELLVAMRDLVPVTSRQQRRSTAEYDLKPAAAMRRLFAGAERVCDASLEIAASCEFELDLHVHHLPELAVNDTIRRLIGSDRLPYGAQGRMHADPACLLEMACDAGLRRRMPARVADRVVLDRVGHELTVIRNLGFSGFFVLVAEICAHIREAGIRVACRGSAAGSLVTYLLEISDVDPIRHDLCFARFVNEYRHSLPDIDIDVESHRRDEILDWIMSRYGHERTAMVAAVDTYRARGAIREVGKALGFPYDEIDVLAKAFPHIRASGISTALEELPELHGRNLDRPHLARLFELCCAIDGFPRHLAVHPCGVIIGPSNLRDLIPFERSPQHLLMTQFDKDDVEDLGLVKLDVLGVRMQSTISHALTEIERVEGRRIDLNGVPFADAETYDLIRASRTLGCFQIESPGQRELLGKLQPTAFDHMVVDISLFRPGPVKNDMVRPFVARHHGEEEARYVSPLLVPFLEETHGVIVYHEQVIRTIAALGGVSEAEADAIRRRLGAPDDPGTIEVGEWLRAAACARGIPAEEAEAIWKEVAGFASFGFCKAHAAAFALVTYQSAWLKAHHPAAFLAGVLTHDPGMYHSRLFVHEARRLGVPVLPVDVNGSAGEDRVELTWVN